ARVALHVAAPRRRDADLLAARHARGLPSLDLQPIDLAVDGLAVDRGEVRAEIQSPGGNDASSASRAAPGSSALHHARPGQLPRAGDEPGEPADQGPAVDADAARADEARRAAEDPGATHERSGAPDGGAALVLLGAHPADAGRRLRRHRASRARGEPAAG